MSQDFQYSEFQKGSTERANPSMTIKMTFMLYLVFLGIVIAFFSRTGNLYLITPDPKDTSQYYEVRSYRWQSFIPVGFGQGGDKSGKIYLKNRNGITIQDWHVPMVHMAKSAIENEQLSLFSPENY